MIRNSFVYVICSCIGGIFTFRAGQGVSLRFQCSLSDSSNFLTFPRSTQAEIENEIRRYLNYPFGRDVLTTHEYANPSGPPLRELFSVLLIILLWPARLSRIMGLCQTTPVLRYWRPCFLRLERHSTYPSPSQVDSIPAS